MKIEVKHVNMSHDEALANLVPIPGDDGFFEILQSLTVAFALTREVAGGMTITYNCVHQVPIAFRTDLISAPQWVLDKLGIAEMDFVIAPIVHDSVNKWPVAQTTTSPQTIRLTRKEGDLLFKRLLQWEGLNDGRAHFMYKILRNWGWVAWLRWRIVSLFGGLR